jgi:catalase
MMLSPPEHSRRGRRLLITLAGGVLMALAGCGEEPELGLGEERIAPNEAEIEAAMTDHILEIGRRHQDAGEPIPRFNQPKTVACATGTFEVPPLEDDLAQGLFAEPRRFEALVRFANATQADDREKDLRGLSLRLAGVETARRPGNPAGHQDFLFNSHPALFAGTPEDFGAFVDAVADDRLWWYFLTHPRSLWIVLQARGQPESPLGVRYWSTTPYRYGEDDTRAVKYSMRACPGSPSSPEGAGPEDDDPDYLRQALARQLDHGEACLSLMVQFQTDPVAMPIEDASVIWDEDASPFIPVAQLTLPRQEIADPGALARCDALAFNPWNTHSAHRPLGGINRMRDDLYRQAGEQRTTHNASLAGSSSDSPAASPEGDRQ